MTAPSPPEPVATGTARGIAGDPAAARWVLVFRAATGAEGYLDTVGGALADRTPESPVGDWSDVSATTRNHTVVIAGTT